MAENVEIPDVNEAKDVKTPKMKRIDIPPAARVEINRLNQEINKYISGVVAGMDIEGKWSLDVKSGQITVEEGNI